MIKFSSKTFLNLNQVLILYHSSPDDEFSGFKRTLYSALKYSLIAGLVGLLSYQLNLLGYLPLSSLDDLETIQKVRDFISNTVNTNVD